MKTFKTKKGTELPLLDMRGKDYLQVAHRIFWFREELPEWGIETELVASSPTSALFKATIRNEAGRIMATAHKDEDKTGFPDFIPKAETGAIGRALALCGYGTQFTDELDEGARIVDSPLADKPKVFADKPGPKDGIKTGNDPNKFSFGQWKTLSIEEVYRKEGAAEMIRYFEVLQNRAIQSKSPLTLNQLADIDRARAYIEIMREPGEDMFEEHG